MGIDEHSEKYHRRGISSDLKTPPEGSLQPPAETTRRHGSSRYDLANSQISSNDAHFVMHAADINTLAENLNTIKDRLRAPAEDEGFLETLNRIGFLYRSDNKGDAQTFWTTDDKQLNASGVHKLFKVIKKMRAEPNCDDQTLNRASIFLLLKKALEILGNRIMLANIEFKEESISKSLKAKLHSEKEKLKLQKDNLNLYKALGPADNPDKDHEFNIWMLESINSILALYDFTNSGRFDRRKLGL